VPPEVAGGQATARLSDGADKGIRRTGAVIARRIDRGAREALQRGEPVLTAAGLVGIVEEVGPVTSTVRLVTDPRTNIMVQIISPRGGKWLAGPEGLACGTPDGSAIRVTRVDRNADVAVGDFVVTSPSPESSLPPYLVLGRVVKCDLKAAALSYELTIEPRVSPAEIREVYVMSPETRPAAPGR
jgi:rod shape-determining protein MreC